MAGKKAKVEINWDEETEKKIEKKFEDWSKSCGKNWSKSGASAGGGAVYCLGFVGALVYFLSTATSFTDGLWGIIQAILWPGFVVFELLKFLQL